MKQFDVEYGTKDEYIGREGFEGKNYREVKRFATDYFKQMGYVIWAIYEVKYYRPYGIEDLEQ